MKCPFCGGEVPYQSTSCPYCGRENAEGIAFQEEVRKKAERNKLLKPLLLKQKTPELLQKMITRIILVLAVANVLLLVLNFGIFLWTERDSSRSAAEGSHAERYLQEFEIEEDYYFSCFWEEMNAYVDRTQAGELPGTKEISELVKSAYDVVKSLGNYKKETQQRFTVCMDAFFMGYIGLSGEEMGFLEPDASGEYPFFQDEAVVEAAVRAIEARQKEGMPWQE